LGQSFEASRDFREYCCHEWPGQAAIQQRAISADFVATNTVVWKLIGTSTYLGKNQVVLATDSQNRVV
jgi:hypothetical protein